MNVNFVFSDFFPPTQSPFFSFFFNFSRRSLKSSGKESYLIRFRNYSRTDSLSFLAQTSRRKKKEPAKAKRRGEISAFKSCFENACSSTIPEGQGPRRGVVGEGGTSVGTKKNILQDKLGMIVAPLPGITKISLNPFSNKFSFMAEMKRKIAVPLRKICFPRRVWQKNISNF